LVEKPFGRDMRSGNRAKVRGGVFPAQTEVSPMRIKILAVLVVLAVSTVLFVQLRKDNRADAAASNCYSDAKGPSAPTICN
jgi:hypothetical protein